LKKKKKRNITLAVIGIVGISIVVGFDYFSEQTRIKGFQFGNELQQIQEDLETLQMEFIANEQSFKEKNITKEEFSEFSSGHFEKMNELILRYDSLNPPSTFETSVELLKLSTETQLESEKLIVSWVETGNEDDIIRANEINQQALEFEFAGIASFNEAKSGSNP